MKPKLRNSLYLFAMLNFLISGYSATAQLAFTNANSKIGTTHSGCSVTVTDANFDGLDDIIRLDAGHILNLEIQNRDGSFTNHLVADLASGSAWAMTCADVDHNGWKDIVFDGDNSILLVKIFENAGVISYTSTSLTNSGFFLQNATFADLNNDGWIDLFCCDDNDASHMYLNDGTGNLQISTMIDFAVNPGVTYGSDPADSGNYGSCWIDFDNDNDLDLYVAHCRQSSSSPTDLRRINRLFVNNGNNTFTEQASVYGIDIGWQTWTASFGDLDNDGDLDLVLTNHDHISQIFENDGAGYYSELLNTGFNTNAITPIESVVEDFDNDGYADILVTGSEWMLWKNNGNKTFTQVSGLFANNGMLSFASGDLNHDGFIDIFASYGNIYTTPSSFDDVLYLNNRNSNHFITFNLEGTLSNKGAIGAKVKIYGAWGVQVREIRAGESYGTCNSSQLHFGLGANQNVDSVVVRFPSGTTERLYNLQADQFVTVIENTCTLSGNFISGATAICSGQSATLTATSGFSGYDWSTGETTSAIVVNTAGSYNVMVQDGLGCTNISRTIDLQLNPDETPSIAVNGDLQFCHGGLVTLTSSTAAGYAWSDGITTTRSINVTESGIYSVTIQGQCGAFTSTQIAVNVLSAPLPVVQGVSATAPASVTLTATGNDLYWYDQPTGGMLVGQGTSYTTPVLSSPATYYVENVTDYPGAMYNGGMLYHQGTSFSSQNYNGITSFTVNSPCTLNSVKVYTDSAGPREIQLTDAAGIVLQSVTVNIPIDTSRVSLNFSLTPGDYKITTNATLNQSTLGTVSPRLRRSSNGVSYPYSINNLISITGSNQGNGYYYYFYDWDVNAQGFTCSSDRVPVVADIINSVGTLNAESGIRFFPNPASSFVNVETNSNQPILISVYDCASRLVKVVKVSGGKSVLSIDEFTAGIYILKIAKDGNLYNYKLIVQ